MVTASNRFQPYETELTNGSMTVQADTTADKGGGGQGFRPHELLEAALASCMNIHLRMYAANHGINLKSLRVVVTVDRSDESKTVFNYTIDPGGDLDEGQRAKLFQIAETCPVRRTISKETAFQAAMDPLQPAENSA